MGLNFEKADPETAQAATEGFNDQQGDSHIFNEETKKWEPKQENSNDGRN